MSFGLFDMRSPISLSPFPATIWQINPTVANTNVRVSWIPESAQSNPWRTWSGIPTTWAISFCPIPPRSGQAWCQHASGFKMLGLPRNRPFDQFMPKGSRQFRVQTTGRSQRADVVQNLRNAVCRSGWQVLDLFQIDCSVDIVRPQRFLSRFWRMFPTVWMSQPCRRGGIFFADLWGSELSAGGYSGGRWGGL